MALNANSYGTVEEVQALVKHLLDGDSAFDGSTNPTLAEVEAIQDRVSGVLNTALAGAGFSVPLTNETAVFACADFVVKWVVIELRNMFPHLGIDDEEDRRRVDLFTAANRFAADNKNALQNLGESVGDPTSQGLTFTGLLTHSNRADPQNNTYEQPKFRRGMFES